MKHARVPGGRARDGAEARRLSRRDHPERALFAASRRSTSRRRKPAHARAAAARLATTTRTSCAPARGSTPPPRKRLSEINQRLAGLFTRFSQNVLADENEHVLVLESEADLAGLPESLRRRRRRRRRGAGPRGQVGDRQHALVDGAVPHLLRPARPAREGLAHVRQPRRQRRRARQQRDHHRDPEAARRAREAARLPDARALAARERDGEDARARDGADGGGLAAGRRARARGGRRHAGLARGGARITIEPWDYRYYAEKVRKAKYDLDQNEVKQYLQLEKLREGMFWVAGELFGFALRARRRTCRSTTPTCASGR
jgi:peptidyl-dipeptidase Dcp